MVLDFDVYQWFQNCFLESINVLTVNCHSDDMIIISSVTEYLVFAEFLIPYFKEKAEFGSSVLRRLHMYSSAIVVSMYRMKEQCFPVFILLEADIGWNLDSFSIDGYVELQVVMIIGFDALKRIVTNIALEVFVFFRSTFIGDIKIVDAC